jgi:hypothetical protein
MSRVRKPRPKVAGDCLTIDEFCLRNRISKQFYYKLRAMGQTPIESRLGAKVLITKEAAEEWRRNLLSPRPAA